MSPREVKPFTRASVWVAGKLPKSLVTDTERVGLSLGFIFVGGASMAQVNDTGGIAQILPLWALVEWSVTLFLGGCFTILGIQFGYRALERAGVCLAMIGCFTYSIALFTLPSGRAQVIAVLFLFLAFIKLCRLIISTASAEFMKRENPDSHHG